MSETLELVRALVEQDKFRVSLHAAQELIADGLLIEPIIRDISTAIVVEDYPDYHKGAAVLVLQVDEAGEPIHLVWGLPKGESAPAVLVTAYRPDPQRWDASFTRRRQR